MNQMDMLPFKGTWLGCNNRLKGISQGSAKGNAKSCTWEEVTPATSWSIPPVLPMKTWISCRTKKKKKKKPT